VAQAGEFTDEPAGDARGEQCIATGDDADCVEEPLGSDVLQQEAAGPRA
jgi:hypothetical protein